MNDITIIIQTSLAAPSIYEQTHNEVLDRRKLRKAHITRYLDNCFYGSFINAKTSHCSARYMCRVGCCQVAKLPSTQFCMIGQQHRLRACKLPSKLVMHCINIDFKLNDCC